MALLSTYRHGTDLSFLTIIQTTTRKCSFIENFQNVYHQYQLVLRTILFSLLFTNTRYCPKSFNDSSNGPHPLRSPTFRKSEIDYGRKRILQFLDRTSDFVLAHSLSQAPDG